MNSELSCARVMLRVLKGTLFKPPTLTPTSDEATSDEARSLLKSLAKSLIKLNIAEAVLARRLSKQRKRSLLLNSMAAFGVPLLGGVVEWPAKHGHGGALEVLDLAASRPHTATTLTD